MYGKKYEELTFCDDFMFCKILEQNPALCRELGDETEKIFLFAKGAADDTSEKMQAFLNYIASGTPSDTFTNELENEVKKARDHIKWRTEYMTFLEQLEREREEGREEERVNTECQRKRADEAEKRVDALEADLLELRKQLEALMGK